MATSGVTTLSVTRSQLVSDALLEAGIIAAGETPSDSMMSHAQRSLNMMIKSWQAKELGLWLNLKVTIALAYGTLSYQLGPTGWHCSSAMNETALASDAALGAGSIVVGSATSISNGDNIGIQLSDGTMQWTTVNGAPVGTTVTLTAVLTAAASTDAVVFSYTNKVSRPLGIVDLNVRDSAGNETPLTQLSRQEYMALPNKGTTGKVSQFYHDPQTGLSVLYVWPTCLTVSDRLVGTIKTPVQVFVNAADEPDFPVEWYAALKFGLAVHLCPGYKVPKETFSELLELARVSLSDASGFDREPTSVYFQPDCRWG